MPQPPHATLVYAKLLATALFWGGTWSAGRIVAQQVGPYSASFLRFAIASLFLLGLNLRREGGLPRLRRDQIGPVVLLGLTGVFAYNAFFLKGLKLLEAGRASMIVAINPVVIALLSALLFRERLTPRRMAGVVISVLGALVVISRGDVWALGHGSFGPGEVLILGCVATWAIYTLVGKALMKDLSPLPSVTYSVLVGTVALSIPALGEDLPSHIGSFGLRAWVCVTYLGLFGTVLGFVWFYEGVKAIGAMRSSLFISFVPVCGVFLAHFILGEALNASLLIGAVLVTGGVLLTNWKPKDA